MPRFIANKVLLLLTVIAVLAVSVAAAGWLIYDRQQHQQRGDLLARAASEADFIGAFLTDAMLRHDYSEGRRLLSEWTATHDEVVFLDVTLDNGRTFFAYRDAAGLDETMIIARDFAYRDRRLVIRLAHGTAEMRERLADLKDSLIVLSILSVALMGGALWYVLFRWMIRPMEAEIRHRTRQLQDARESLEVQVRDRTASLTEEVEKRRAAERSLRKMGMAIDQSPILIFMTEPDGVIEYVNPTFERVTGYASREVLGQTPRIIKSPDTPPEVHKDLWETLLAGREWRREIKDRCKDGGEFWANVSIFPILDERGKIVHFVAMHEDITERKQAELAMMEAQSAAELANRAKTELLANMSHELRTPLNAIIGFSETMKGEYFGPLGGDRYREYADHIHFSGTHLLSLINDILDVSAVEAGKMTLHESEIDVREICGAVMRILSPKAEELGIALDCAADRGLPRLLADERRFKQILINLLSNAVKFTPEGGEVLCDAHVDGDGSMVIGVTDTGIGMDEAGIAKALEKFGQVDSSMARKHEGTGLGLPLTKGLVELHGGVMELSSRPGRGTRITLRFPAERVLAV
ncbi:MAG: PAS domain S-box protein [Alphaproteobacteria bacterium]|nr:PAS domain S-box protein [Alphaproteobacteria bacterium]